MSRLTLMSLNSDREPRRMGDSATAGLPGPSASPLPREERASMDGALDRIYPADRHQGRRCPLEEVHWRQLFALI